MAVQSQMLICSDKERAWDNSCIESLCDPYVLELMDVLLGEKSRYMLTFQNATFYFYHGCLLNQVMYLGKMVLLPTIQVDKNGKPYWNIPTTSRLRWLTDLTQLPKGIVIFYFTLLKKLFPAHQRWDNLTQLPASISPFMEEAGWSFR